MQKQSSEDTPAPENIDPAPAPRVFGERIEALGLSGMLPYWDESNEANPSVLWQWTQRLFNRPPSGE